MSNKALEFEGVVSLEMFRCALMRSAVTGRHFSAYTHKRSVWPMKVGGVNVYGEVRA
jgi:hypothetical protein